MPQIRCPYCRSLNTKLKHGKRERERGYIRIRVCKDCGRRFKTIERLSYEATQEVEDIGKVK